MYLNYFNLTKEPFRLTPDPEFIYYSRIHQDVFQTIMYGVNASKGFIVLTGPVGSGKTTICRLLMNHCSKKETQVKIAYIFNPSLSFPELLHAILKDFGIRYRKKDSTKVYLLDTLNKFLIKEYSRDVKVVIIIDEAQLLSIETLEELRLLTNLETDTHKLLQIIICGQEELQDIINSPRLRQLKQRINLHCQLTSLRFDDMEKYIRHRLEIAGRQDSISFTYPALRKLFSYSRGIPRKINSICDKSLLSAYAMNKLSIDYRCIIDAIEVVEGKSFRLRDNLVFIYYLLSSRKGIAVASLVFILIAAFFFSFIPVN